MATHTWKGQVQGFARRRLSELCGVGFCLVAIFLLLAILTYSEADPSFNRTGGAIVLNLGGVAGAYMADLALQLTGVASLFSVLVLFAWGWRLLSKQYLHGWWMRITALLVGLISLSVFFASIDAPLIWPIQTGLGGAIGMMVRDQISSFLPIWGYLPVAVIISALAVPVAFGLRKSEWSALFDLLKQAGKMVVSFVGLVRAALHGSADNQSLNPFYPDDQRSLWRRLLFWKREEPIALPEPAKVRKPRVDKPKKTGRKKEEENQSSFELKLKEGNFSLPSLALLEKVPTRRKQGISESSLAQNAEMLEKVLADFGVKGEIVRVRPGPVVTLYELEPAAGTKSSRVIGLADDIARSMSAISARISVIPGRNALGIELPNSTREMVYLREILESDVYDANEARLPLALGKDIGGDPIVVDLARMPHLLVAGTTGSGKSVAINTMILSLLYQLTPEQCKFIMIDPKMLELSVYDDIPHLLSPVVTEPTKAVVALKWTVREMENRYKLMSNLGVRNIDSYNKRLREAAKKGEELFRTVQTGFDPDTGKPVMERVPLETTPLPYIVVVVDEMADLMLVAGKDIETSIQRLAQMARAAGIHIIMATQRPSVDVITGVIKANFPTRISFQVTSKIDSRTVLGEQGAEQLLGQGDMLYMAGGGRITRIHGPFVDDLDVEKVVDYLKMQGEPEYDEGITIDEDEEDAFAEIDEDDPEEMLYQQAVRIVLQDRKASTSYIQRRLKIGYNRAARLVDRMEEEGLVGQANHAGKREVLARALD